MNPESSHYFAITQLRFGAIASPLSSFYEPQTLTHQNLAAIAPEISLNPLLKLKPLSTQLFTQTVDLLEPFIEMKNGTYQASHWRDRSPTKDPSNLELTAKKLKESSQPRTKQANVPVERLSITSASYLQSLVSPLQQDCYTPFSIPHPITKMEEFNVSIV